jgi:predicted ATP-dependent endonuclease of OLD family
LEQLNVRLTAVQVTNFRNILDSTEFEIDDVTCLVGKNEAGKTSILQALKALRPHDSSEAVYDLETDYPRAHKSNQDGRESIVLATTWELSNEDVQAVEDVLGPKTLNDRSVKILKGYDSLTGAVKINEKVVLQVIADECGVLGAEKTAFLAQRNTADASKFILQKGADASTELLLAKAKIDKFPGGRADAEAANVLNNRIPRFLYFGNYDIMSGNVAVNKLKQNVENKTLSASEEVFLAFLEYAGVSLAALDTLTNTESLIATLESASNAITEQMFEYWSQNQFLRVQFLKNMGMPADPPPFNEGWNLRTRVYNELHKATVNFDERSTGFVWFFSFLVLFSSVRKKFGNVIILLDEPGLSLHGRAQADLLRFIDAKLMPEHQVIYTTHSPFMVPADKITRVRTVEDVVNYTAKAKPTALGTKVSKDVMSSDADTLFPLQGALGYEITQSLFIGRHTLLLEGPGDVLMLQSASARLTSLGREGLSVRWVMCPVGGLGKILPFVNLFGANGLDLAALTDFGTSDKQLVDQLRKNEILKSGRLFTCDFFCEQAEADIEDFFGPVLYARMVNSAYKLGNRYHLNETKIQSVALTTPRIVKRVEKFFSSDNLPGSTPEFDHYTPAYWLQMNPQFWSDNAVESEIVLKRFEAFFKAVNHLLPNPN